MYISQTTSWPISAHPLPALHLGYISLINTPYIFIPWSIPSDPLLWHRRLYTSSELSLGGWSNRAEAQSVSILHYSLLFLPGTPQFHCQTYASKTLAGSIIKRLDCDAKMKKSWTFSRRCFYADLSFSLKIVGFMASSYFSPGILYHSVYIHSSSSYALRSHKPSTKCSIYESFSLWWSSLFLPANKPPATLFRSSLEGRCLGKWANESLSHLISHEGIFLW